MQAEDLEKATDLNKRVIAVRERIKRANMGIIICYDGGNGGRYPLDGVTPQMKTIITSIILSALEKELRTLEAQFAAL